MCVVYTNVDIKAFSSWGSRIWKIMNVNHVMDNIRNACERSEMTLDQLGTGLGYEGPTARKRAWFLLYRTSDPRMSTVLAVAQTLDVKIADLVE